jgi:hypothetical protein
MFEPAEEVICAVCGGSARQFARASSDHSSPPDFDTRPGETGAGTPDMWVAQCPHCGYCAEDISTAPPGTADLVRSPEYLEHLEDRSFPPVVRRFLCYAFLVEKSHYWADAGWIWIHAAWACDDAGDVEAAQRCRGLALDRWKRGKELGQSFADDLASEFAIIVDLYRRLGRFEDATVTCTEALDLEDVPVPIEQMLRRQMILIQQRDTGRHSMAELYQSY